MLGLQKSKGVTWASDINLCQVRLFLSEESPSQVGLGAQDHLQAKASWLSHAAGTASDDALPPGFEGGDTTNLSQIRLSDVPVIRWLCPPRFVLDLTWQVVAGEESEDTDVQNQREMRVLEAVYPRASAIPLNPAFSADLEELRHGDHQVHQIPVTPIEDEDATDLMPSAPISAQSQLLAPPPQCRISPNNEKPSAAVPPGLEPDVLAFESAAFAAMNKSNEQGSLIDHSLLTKILNNPKLIEKLVQDYGAAPNLQNKAKPIASFTPSLDPLPPPVFLSYMHMNRTETKSSSSFPATTNGAERGYPPNSHHPPPAVRASSAPYVTLPQVKPTNYNKNLIQQHGVQRQETPHQYGNRYGHHVGTNQYLVNLKPRDSKHKIMKPCIYYNSSRGCRNGANCAYQHDVSSHQQSSASAISEVQNAKRMKIDGEISS